MLSKVIAVGSRNSYDTKIHISQRKSFEANSDVTGSDNLGFDEDDEDDDAMSFRLSPRSSYNSLSSRNDLSSRDIETKPREEEEKRDADLDMI